MRPVLLLFALGLATAAGATTYSVGPSRTYTSPCQLVAAVTLGAGDVVEVDPATYRNACQLRASGSPAAPITLRGLPGPRPVFDATGLDLSGSGTVPRAIFQFTGGSYWVVQHLELTHASNVSSNGAAFRATAGAHDILIEDVSVHDCQDGFMSDGVATVTVRFSDVFHNGAGDGYSHNFYMQGQTTILIGNHIHDSAGGQNVKIRSHDAALLYNRIENAGNYEIDLIQALPLTSDPNANVVLLGNVIARPSSADNNSQVIVWGSDNPSEIGRNGNLYAVNNTFVLQNAGNRLFHAISPAAGSQIILDNNIVFASVNGTGLATDATTANILVGSHNWIGSNIAAAGMLTSILTGNDPGFVSAADFHLSAGAPPINAGLAGVTYLDGNGMTQSARPTEEFAAPAGLTPRPSDGALDLGAYEFAAAGTADGGSGADAGWGADAGSGLDAGTDGGSGSPASGGGAAEAVVGGCSVPPVGLGWAPLAAFLAALPVLLRRRR
jgi:hypothetical protein